MPSFDPSLPAVLTRQEARAAGLSDRQISRRCSTGAWTVLRRGVFSTVPVTGPGSPPAPTTGPHPAPDVLAALLGSGRELVVSHGSAAQTWGLPRPLRGWPEPTFTATHGPTRRRAGVRVLVSPLHDDDVFRLASGVLVTSAARTVADLLRTEPAPDALAVGDAAVRRWVAPCAVHACLDRSAGWPGLPRAQRIAALLDGRHESPLESWSALAFARERVPMPAWQVDVLDARGHVGRVDAWWPQGVVGEADGRAKCALAAAERRGSGADGFAAVLHEERRREGRLRSSGASVVRWGARDVLVDPARRDLAVQLRRELGWAEARDCRAAVRVAAVVLPPCTCPTACRAPAGCTPGA